MSEEQAMASIKNAVEANAVCLFMKGTPQQPMCGFSAHVIQILNQYGVKFHSVNVLDDWDVREAIKKYASWPTIPQLYVNGKFIGGSDITAELHKKGELGPILGTPPKA